MSKKVIVYEAWSRNADGTYAVLSYCRKKNGSVEVIKMDSAIERPWKTIDLPEEFITEPPRRKERAK